MKCYVEICSLNYPLPNKDMEIHAQEAEILPGSIFFPSLALIVPLHNVKFIKIGEKPLPKPAPEAAPRPKAETGRAKAKKSPPKKPAKPKPAVRTSKKVRSK